MKPFKHINVKTIDAAISALSKKSKIIAGGTDYLSLLKSSVLPVYPEILVNIKTIPGLNYLKEGAEGLRIGALATLSDIAESPVIKEKYGILADAARSVASPQIRNMGTIGGNLCQGVRCWYYRCSPLTGKSYLCYRKGGRECFAEAGDNRYHAVIGGKACFAVCPSDTAIALTALDAKIKIKGPAKERTLLVKNFYRTLGNVLKPDEIVTEVQIPEAPAPKAKHSFLKFRLRKAIDFAIVSVASVIRMEDGVCKGARIALGAVAPTPIRATKTEAAIKGKVINTTMAETAAQAAVASAAPLSMNEYKVEITKALVKRAILT
ncbi:FAD binding domain-containing protein [Thermodesulfobacteriota bacterium]